MVHPPSSQLVFEIISNADTSPDWLVNDAKVLTSPRFDFGEQSLSAMAWDGNYMEPLWVSNLATSVDQVREYFISLFEQFDLEYDVSTGADPLGASYKKLQMKLTVTGQDRPMWLRFIEPNMKSEGYFSVEWWEGYLKDVHAEFMRSPTCGWDILGESHFTFSWSEEYVIDDLLAQAEKMQYSYFCQKLNNSNIDCFLNTPFGVQIELKGPSLNADRYYKYEYSQQCASYHEWCDGEISDNKIAADEQTDFAADEDSAFSAGSTSDALWCSLGIVIVILGHIRVKPAKEEQSLKTKKSYLAKIRGHANTPGKRTHTLGGKVHPDLNPVKDPDVLSDIDNGLLV